MQLLKKYPVAKEKKKLIIKLITEGGNRFGVYCTKQGANKLTESMISAGIQAAAIHGNKGQGARTKALAGFNGSLTALVATDIAARGLDIPLLPHVKF
jgi:ATP-dependent RNA helicase RhlE